MLQTSDSSVSVKLLRIKMSLHDLSQHLDRGRMARLSSHRPISMISSERQVTHHGLSK